MGKCKACDLDLEDWEVGLICEGCAGDPVMERKSNDRTCVEQHGNGMTCSQCDGS